jgi:type II secretory pathway pseudopilin PulG
MRRGKPSEDGFILVSVMFILALLIIAMAVALPKISADIQRDREIETMHRGLQYRRAIQLYFRKFNRYPPNMDALVKTNEIRFLRKKYVDPTTGKAEWKPVLFGQNKTPLAMGFFGQPLGGIGMGGSPLAGTGPGGGNGMPGSSAIGSNGSSFGSNSSSFGSNSSSFGSNTSTFGSNSSALGGNPSTTGAAANGTDPSATGISGAVDANGNPVDTNTNPGGGGFGGAGIIGVSPTSPKQSILVYKKKNHYNEWEFLYSILSEQQGGFNTAPQPIASPPGVGSPGVPIQAPNGGATQSPTTPNPPPTQQ